MCRMKFSDLDIRESEIWRYLGYQKQHSEISSSLQQLLQGQLQVLEELAQPQASYRLRPAAELTRQPAQGQSIKKYLQQAPYIIVLTVTIGAAVEQQVNKLFQEQRYAEAVILDAAGTAAVEAAADYTEQRLRWQALAFGWQLRPRFSPGYGDWPLLVQQQMLCWSGGDIMGVAVNRSMLLLPQKTITAVMALFTESAAPVGAKQRIFSELKQDFDSCLDNNLYKDYDAVSAEKNMTKINKCLACAWQNCSFRKDD